MGHRDAWMGGEARGIPGHASRRFGSSQSRSSVLALIGHWHTQEAERFSPNQELTLQVELLRDEVRRLKEVQEFDKKLLESVSSKGIDFSV
jgi:hypothetical protein